MTAALGSGSCATQSTRMPACHGSRRAGTSRAARAIMRATGAPSVSPSISGVKATAQPISAWSSTGISITMPRRRSGASEATSSVVLAPSEVPITTASLDLEVVEQRHDLAPELGHRVAPHVGRAVRLAVAEQVERQHAVAALGERAGERVVHVAAEQQAVQQHDDARPSP